MNWIRKMMVRARMNRNKRHDTEAHMIERLKINMAHVQLQAKGFIKMKQ